MNTTARNRKMEEFVKRIKDAQREVHHQITENDATLQDVLDQIEIRKMDEIVVFTLPYLIDGQPIRAPEHKILLTDINNAFKNDADLLYVDEMSTSYNYSVIPHNYDFKVDPLNMVDRRCFILRFRECHSNKIMYDDGNLDVDYVESFINHY